MRVMSTLLITVFLLGGCSSSSSNNDAGPSGDGAGTGDGAVADGPQTDGPRGDGPVTASDTGPKSDTKPPKVTWSIVGQQNDVAWDNGHLALHPTQAKTLAVKLEVSTFDPNNGLQRLCAALRKEVVRPGLAACRVQAERGAVVAP